METVGNMAKAAAEAVWGNTSTTDEPVNGKVGDVSKGEPYDAGNIGVMDAEPGDAQRLIDQCANSEPPAKAVHMTKVEPSSDAKAAATRATGVGLMDVESTNASTSTSTSDTTPTISTPAGTKPPSGATLPGENKSSPSVRTTSTFNRKTNTNTSNVTTSPAKSDIRQNAAANKANVGEMDDGIDLGDTSNKELGVGPRSLAELAKEGGGNAANASPNASSVDHTKVDSDDAGPQKQRKGSGTEKQYVKSTGLHADGGDFDATRPGAGREADRLLEEKGIMREVLNGADDKHNGGSGGKTRLTNKIKDVFHQASKD